MQVLCELQNKYPMKVRLQISSEVNLHYQDHTSMLPQVIA